MDECSEEDEFNLAAKYVQLNADSFKRSDLLMLYAYYKQATIGPCNIPKPSFYMMKEKSKWESWHSLKSMNKTDAITKYINVINASNPYWKKTLNINSDNFGISVSRPKMIDTIEEGQKTIQDYIREENSNKFAIALNALGSKEINSLDENGLGLIHWAADRGNLKILKMLLDRNDIDINLRDDTNQTALFYASSCGHYACLKMLLDYSADKTLTDNDDCTSLDVAYDDEVKSILR